VVTETDERILEELRQLPAVELRQLREQVNNLLAEVEPCRPSREETDDALCALYGKYEGRGLMKTLLEERARERAHVGNTENPSNWTASRSRLSVTTNSVSPVTRAEAR
jgi:hypothetical protein